MLRAGLGWREIVILRAYCKYLRQAGVTFSETYMQEALAANPAIAAMLVELFHVRLDPDRPREAPAAKDAESAKDAAIEQLDAELEVMTRIEEALDEVANLDEDRILRSYIGVIRATLRTNHFQPGPDGAPKPYLSFKPRPAPDPRAARTAADVRDLRLLAAGGGGASARRRRRPPAASAGRTGARTSAPRCWGSPRRSR